VTLRARPWLDQVEPYSPGRKAPSADGSMASNESPVGTSPQVVRAVTRAAANAARYPDPLADSLRFELATQHEVDPEQILVGNGSDELIFLLAMAYLAQGGHAICADPAYRIDEISARIVNARLTCVPLKGWSHDLDAMAELAADVAYVVNPHNPTGTAHRRADIEKFARSSRADLVVVDEAYIDFTDDPDATTAIGLARSGEAVVLRTFSKIHGLAGLRVGYLIGDPDIVATLRKIRAPFSVGSLAQAGALAAARDPAHRDRVRQHIVTHRRGLTRLLEQAGYTVIPSQANFVLAITDDEAGLLKRLSAHGVTARPGTSLGLPGSVRISVPSERGLALLSAALPPR
jgi:histidinol-phosphate aminotransferase